MNTTIPTGVWRNNKLGKLYRIWHIAIDHPGGNRFVVYQDAKLPASQALMLFVQHSETLTKGTLSLRQTGWVINWHEKPVLIHNDPVRAAAWARPLEAWASKFTPQDGQR